MTSRSSKRGHGSAPDRATGICAHCGKPGEIGPEITVLASRDEVHHECWPAFVGAAIKRRAV